MIDRGRHDLLGVGIDAVDYEAAVARIMDAAEAGTRLTVAALAVHGVMTGVLDREQRYRLNALDLVVPDGQPVRWAIDFFHHTRLPDRVYGPDLTLAVCEAAAERGLPVYFYGSRADVVFRLSDNLKRRIPSLQVAGCEPSRFRRLSPSERDEVVHSIRGSGAAITFVGLGCPRQETWVYEMGPLLSMPSIAVGAAFDFHSGSLPQAPGWMQDHGLEWLFRFAREPKRLWRRYLFLNPAFMFLVLMQARRLGRFDAGVAPEEEALHG